MTEFKIDLHVHTKETSPCGGVYAEDAVKMYYKAGYQAIVITDHYFNGYFDSLGDLPWEEKVNSYLGGYHAAVKAAKSLDFQVFLGMEFRNQETDDDFLVFGFEPSFLYEHPLLYKKTLPEAFSCFHGEGAIVIQAHPARVRLAVPDGRCVKKNFHQEEMLQYMKLHPNLPEISFLEGDKLCRENNVNAIQTPTLLRVCNLRYPEDLDGIESFNANYHWVQNPQEIQRILEDYPHLIGVSASDFHEKAHLAKGGIVLDTYISNIKELIAALKDRRFQNII